MVQNGFFFINNGKIYWNIPPISHKWRLNFFQTILDKIFENFFVFLQYNSKPQVNGNWFNRLESHPLQLQLQKVNIEHWIIGYEDWCGPRTSYIPFRSLLLNTTEAWKGFLKSALFQEIFIFRGELSIPIFSYFTQYSQYILTGIVSKNTKCSFSRKWYTIAKFGIHFQRKICLFLLLMSQSAD